jgi:beta-glucosidase/6-phospho-beta-glucosidase/beta-galactosidase
MITCINKVRSLDTQGNRLQFGLVAEDIARIAALACLGVKTYSFAIAWSRIFPYGNGLVNKVALAHYDDCG